MGSEAAVKPAVEVINMKVIRVRFYDRLGRISENGNFAYITFHVGEESKPNLLVQVTRIKGIPVIVAKFVEGEFLSAFRKPVNIKNLDDLKKFNVPDETIEEIRRVCLEKGVDWV